MNFSQKYKYFKKSSYIRKTIAQLTNINMKSVQTKQLAWRKGLMKRTSLVLAFFFAFMSFAGAQSLKVTGTVKNNQGGAETGVVVFLKSDKSVAAMTDSEGRYSITVPAGDEVIVFSILGFKTAEVPVSGRSVVNVVLEEDATYLDEVVVVGYGTQRKQFVVGSVSQATSKDLLKAPTSDVQSMLTGRLAGMTNIQKTGTPGEGNNTMLVRGLSTFNNSGPLVIVDGVPRTMNNINPNDIATVSILKDAATAAIYGVQAANGVVLITTKTGAQGKANISYDGSVTFSTNTAVPDLMNAEQYIYWHNKAKEMDGQEPYWTEEKIAKMKEMGVYGETDWFSKIFDNYGLTHQHNVSASGGTDKIRYYASLGLMDEDGILRNTNYRRYNVRGSIDADLAQNLKLTMNIAGNYSDRHWPGLNFKSQSEFSPITQAYYAVPCVASEYKDPETGKGYPLGYTNGTYTYNSGAALDTGYQNQVSYRAEVSSKVEYDFKAIPFLSGLKASVFMGYNYLHTADRNFLESYTIYKYDPKSMSVIPQTSLGISETNFNRSSSIGWNLMIRPQLTYEREFGKHNVSGLFLFERYKSYGETMTGYKKGYFSDYPVDISTGMSDNYPYTSGSFSHSGMASFAGRLSYAYDKRYLAEFTFRADGSYKFAPEDRWGYFPSVALGWVISEEGFMDEVTFIDHLKLRASAGVLGSDDTGEYLYMQTYSSTGTASYIWDGVGKPAFYTTGYVHEGLTWSRTNTYNVGVELKALDNRLSFEFDWFYKYTKNILEYGSSTYAPSLGGNNPYWDNSGEVDNRGFDMTINWGDAYANGWSYNLTGIVGWSRNKVLKKKIADDHPSYRAILGQPMGSIYGFNALGLFQTQEQVDNYPTAPSGWLELGAIMYEDVNGDGKIDSNHDYVKIGRSSIPEMTFSFNAEVAWKDLSLSVLLQGATLCNYQLNGCYNNGNTDGTMFTRQFYGGGNSLLHLVSDSWRPDNTDARYPRLAASTNPNNAWASSWWVIDGSYLRVKNVQLSYSLPKKILNFGKNGGIDRVRIYAAGTNLLTFSSYKYLDPENPGINNGYYPQQRTFSLGLNLTF